MFMAHYDRIVFSEHFLESSFRINYTSLKALAIIQTVVELPVIKHLDKGAMIKL